MAIKACSECGKDISTEADACPHCGAKVKKGAGCLGWFAAAFALFIVLAVVGRLRNSDGDGSPPAGISEHAKALNDIKITKFSWRKGGFDNVFIADFTVKNTGKYPIKDIEVTCHSFGASGTLIDTNKRQIFDRFPPGSSKRIRDFSMGFQHSQARSANCEITDLSSI